MAVELCSGSRHCSDAEVSVDHLQALSGHVDLSALERVELAIRSVVFEVEMGSLVSDLLLGGVVPQLID